MQLVGEVVTPTPGSMPPLAEAAGSIVTTLSQYTVIRRNGAVVGFEPGKISVAMTKAFLAVEGGQGAGSARVRELVSALTETVSGTLARRQPSGSQSSRVLRF